jgi:hypothetical protein
MSPCERYCSNRNSSLGLLGGWTGNWGGGVVTWDGLWTPAGGVGARPPQGSMPQSRQWSVRRPRRWWGRKEPDPGHATPAHLERDIGQALPDSGIGTRPRPARVNFRPRQRRRHAEPRRPGPAARALARATTRRHRARRASEAWRARRSGLLAQWPAICSRLPSR